MNKTFSQTDEDGNNPDTTSSATAKPDGTSSYVKGITAGRARALVGVVVGLSSLVIGWRAKVRSAAATAKGKSGPTVALLLGLIAIILSIVHLSTSVGAVFGSGSGKAGALFAIVLGLIGIILGRLALSSRKHG